MTTKEIKRYFNLARNASTFSDYEHNKVGAVLVYKHDIISMGYNRKVSNPIQKKYNIYRQDEYRCYDVDIQHNYIHAEIDCILKAKKEFNGNMGKCNLFIYRQTKTGKRGLSAPCSACSHCLADNGIINIYYSTSNGYVYEKRIWVIIYVILILYSDFSNMMEELTIKQI